MTSIAISSAGNDFHGVKNQHRLKLNLALPMQKKKQHRLKLNLALPMQKKTTQAEVELSTTNAKCINNTIFLLLCVYKMEKKIPYHQNNSKI